MNLGNVARTISELPSDVQEKKTVILDEDGNKLPIYLCLDSEDGQPYFVIEPGYYYSNGE